MPTITYTGINQAVEYEGRDDTLLDVSIEQKIPHLHECGGNGRCTTCRIRVVDGHENLSRPTAQEKQMAHLRRWDPSIRLACQCYPEGDVKIQRLVWTSAEINKLQLETVPEGEAEERAIAIMFCDMRDFTALTSKNNSFDMAHILNRFYTVLGDPILMNNGVIYQYVGDEIVGIFGTSGGTKQKNCMDAVRAALGMKYAIKRLNGMELTDFNAELKVGISIHFGRAYIGHLGHPKHRQFAVIGDPVNVSSRIQDLTKETESGILISKSVYKNLPDGHLKINQVINRNLKGKEESFELYEIEGFSEPDIHLELQSSLDYILQNAEVFSQKFYEKVFQAAPQVRSLFKNNMKAQGRLVMHMIAGIVYTLSRPEHLKMGLASLGKSHEKYGVRPEYYPVVLECLLETIKEEMGVHYTEKVGTAWRQGLGLVIDMMKNWKQAEQPQHSHSF